MYRFKVDVYRLLPAPSQGAMGLYAPDPHQAGVPCYFDPTPEYDQPSAVGRNKVENIFTLDGFWFPGEYLPEGGDADVPVDVVDTDMLIMRSVVGPMTSLIGIWWAAKGNAQPHPYLLDDYMVYAKRTGTKPPPGVSA
ncbi:hypothetical protein OP10G_0162 [Fimbriimonas ginsengisoli Gsoil 348]|uniref:Uncharacterized protein n=2 Tax=Fimbriimonas ginsengisoli TaxID=1005039 RepID=A0A068NL98_FIMGI|nr:hypothetical protein OP10G_0162 [Fimbriimonas ginsengisoli Gsoil 348]